MPEACCGGSLLLLRHGDVLQHAVPPDLGRTGCGLPDGHRVKLALAGQWGAETDVPSLANPKDTSGSFSKPS